MGRSKRAPLRKGLVVLALIMSACSESSVDPAPSAATNVTEAPTTASSASSSSTSTTSAPAQPGAAGIGDSMFANLGNGGYDVSHYSLDLEFDGETLTGLATLTVVPQVFLESFQLDLTGMTVDGVLIDGEEIGFDLQEYIWREDMSAARAGRFCGHRLPRNALHDPECGREVSRRLA